MSSHDECHQDAVADAIHADRYADIGELEYDCPYCFGEEVFKHLNSSTDDVQCGGCGRTGTVDNGVVTVDPECVALTQPDFDHALVMIPQWPNDRPLPDPYINFLADCLAELRKVKA